MAIQFNRLRVFTLLMAISVVCGRRVDAVDENLQRVPAPFMTYQGAPWLERHDREEEEMPKAVIAAMGLKPGDVAADIGCGTGYFARRMAPLVAPGGRVFGVDIQPEMLDMMMKKVEEEGIKGIVPVLSDEDNPKLPRGEVDWMILVDVYHEFSKPEPMLAKMREALSPRGRIALVEYRNEDGTGDHIKPDHRMSARQVLQEWKPAGFELVDLKEFLPHQHVFFFRASGAASGAAENAKQPVLQDLDLNAALKEKKVEIQLSGADKESVTLKIKRAGSERVFITAPAGLYFKAKGENGIDLVARRDAAILLDQDGWQEWKILATAVGAADAVIKPDLEIEPAGNRPELRRLMFYLQAGGVTPEITHTAALIAARDATLDALGKTSAYDTTVALYFCDRAGIDITKRKIWAERGKVLGGLSDGDLKHWLKEEAEKP